MEKGVGRLTFEMGARLAALRIKRARHDAKAAAVREQLYSLIREIPEGTNVTDILVASGVSRPTIYELMSGRK